MFSRRHPFLFFTIILVSVIMACLLGIHIMIAIISGKLRNDRFVVSEGEKIGIVEVVGQIVSSKNAISQLKEFREDDAIKGIVLRIDSPGGIVGPSQEIHREIEKTVKIKKVIVSMGSVAASGGYYIASAADGIMANPGTITGSIGVILGFANYQELLNKIGIKTVVIKSGKYKDIGSPARPMKAEEEKILQDFSDSIHQQFINAVAQGRKLSVSKVEEFSDGRIFSGEQALNLGLVDRLGNLEDAIKWAGDINGATGKLAPVYPKKKKDSLLKEFLEISIEEIASRVAVFGNPGASYRYLPSGD